MPAGIPLSREAKAQLETSATTLLWDRIEEPGLLFLSLCGDWVELEKKQETPIIGFFLLGLSAIIEMDLSGPVFGRYVWIIVFSNLQVQALDQFYPSIGSQLADPKIQQPRLSKGKKEHQSLFIYLIIGMLITFLINFMGFLDRARLE
ncbi:hypothetical protein NQZ79_g8919 [Umbelopsis isabellina]|nr:hypothetical protein NQZ79_g8919 [Umbelopsis isabellina]